MVSAKNTTLGFPKESARRLRFEPFGSITATDVQTAIQQAVQLGLPPGWVNASSFSSIQAAMNAVGALGGGTVLLPAGVINVTGLTVPGGVRLIGAGYPYNTGVPGGPGGAVGALTGTILSAGNTDATVITFNAAGLTGGMDNISIAGCGMVAGAPPAQPAVALNNGTDNITIRNCNITGGGNAININFSREFEIERCFVGQSYGGAAIYITQSGGWIKRSFINQPWNNQAPSFPATVTPWSQSLPVTTGQLISSNGWLLQAQNTATTSSSGTGPTILSYGVGFALDGTVQWILRAPLLYYGIHFDSLSNVLSIEDTDMSGAHTAGLTMTDTLLSGIPGSVVLNSSTSSNAMTNAVLLQAGRECIINACRLNSVTVATGSVVRATSAWTGDLSIAASAFRTGVYGVTLEGGTRARVSDSRFAGFTGAALHASAGVSDFAWSENDLGGNSLGAINAVGALVDAGGSDWYTIENNDTHGATTPITDGGSGTNKRVKNNTQATPLLQFSGPFNPTGTANLTRTMMGLAISVTPRSTGNFVISANMQIGNSIAGDGGSARILFGTPIGSAPANGAAESGTIVGVGNKSTSVVAGSGMTAPITPQVLNGLVVGTTYWFDVSLQALIAGTATITGCNMTFQEV